MGDGRWVALGQVVWYPIAIVPFLSSTDYNHNGDSHSSHDIDKTAFLSVRPVHSIAGQLTAVITQPSIHLFNINRVPYSKIITSPSTPPLLTSLRIRPRRPIALRNRIIDINQDARVGGRVRTRERHQALGAVRAAAARDGDLRARDVELGAAGRPSRVQADMFGAEEVVTVLEAFGDCGGYGAGAFFLVSC